MPLKRSASDRIHSWPGLGRYGVETAVVLILYVITARLGFLVAIPPRNVTILWPPSGVALGALLIWGYRSCTGIILGALAANIWSIPETVPLLHTAGISMGITAGSTLQAMGTAAVLNRFFALNALLKTLQGLFQFAAVSAVGCTIAASCGLASLASVNLVQGDEFAMVWRTWWLGDWVGTLVFAPVFYILSLSVSKPGDLQAYMPSVLWSIGVGATVIVFAIMRSVENDAIEAQLELDARTSRTAIESTMLSNMKNLNAVTGLFLSSSHVSRDEFRRFAAMLLKDNKDISGIQALEWIPRVTAAERAKFEESVQADGFPSFIFMEKNRTGNTVAAGNRPEYFPVYYVEPMNGNIRALGFDLASASEPRKAMNNARETGDAVATPAISLLQEKGNQKGFLIFQPVYKPSTKRSGHAQKPSSGELWGFATGVFRIGDMVQASLNRIPNHPIRITLVDRTTHGKNEILYGDSLRDLQMSASEFNGHIASIKKGFHHSSRIEIAGRQWEIISEATDEYIEQRRSADIWIILIAGFGITILMILYAMNRQKIEDVLRRNHEKQIELTNEIQQQQTRLLLSEKMSSVGQLAAGIAHEINNPAGFVSGNLETLKRYVQDMLQLDDRYRSLVDRLGDCTSLETENIREISEFRKNIRFDFLRLDIGDLLEESAEGMERIARIVADLRDFAHVEKSGLQEQCNIEEIIDNAINVAWNKLKYKCTVHREYTGIPMTSVNRGEIGQVILNILLNAAQSMEDKGDIFVRTASLKDEILLEFEDTGIGIPEDAKQKIFDPFFTTKPVGQGTGLGLHICQKIVDAHKGRIQVESEFQKGTRFKIFLPITQANDNVEKMERDYWRWQS